MFIWFVVIAPVFVAEVFRSPMVDYRVVMLGAVLPLVEVLLPHPVFFHSLLAPVLALTVVMLSTIGRRLVRRRYLGFPIGMFMHILLDGTWTNDALILWPLKGLQLSDVKTPEETAPLGLLILLEVAGVAVGVWAYRRYGLSIEKNRLHFFRSGHLDRSVLK